MKNKLKRFIDNIKGMVISSYMCLRFPFLYPRNAMTGLHKNCWRIRNYHREHYRNCVIDVYIKTTKVEKLESVKAVYTSNTPEVFGTMFGPDILLLFKDNKHLTDIYLPELFNVAPTNYNIVINYNSDKRYLDVNVEHIDGEEYDYGTRPKDVKFIYAIVTNKWKYRWIKFLDWIEKYPYQWINCIPTYSWYDAIPYGWRKAFGMQLMKELKTELLRVGGRKALKQLNITDIKEKWGSLQIYCSGPGYIHEIVEKYEYISFRTCIDCGRPAQGVTNGYVLPYCKDCFENSNSISMTPFFAKENSWYGYTRSDVSDNIVNPKYADKDKK